MNPVEHGNLLAPWIACSLILDYVTRVFVLQPDNFVSQVCAKNSDLMNSLQLACVNEGAGNGEVIQESSCKL